jgi:hypothetical protein
MKNLFDLSAEVDLTDRQPESDQRPLRPEQVHPAHPLSGCHQEMLLDMMRGSFIRNGEYRWD